MIYSIENDLFSVKVKEDGCELNSLKSKKTGIEYLWQGNPDVWYGQSPILFPIIGRLLNDKYKYNGKEYSLAKHGFARKSKFDLVEITNNSITMSLKSSENTLNVYPFEFELLIKYEIKDNTLFATYKVISIGNDMYFSLGGHPGFNCQVGDYLEFENNETICTERIDKESIIRPESFPLLNNEKRITITKDIFVEDALILSGYNSNRICLKSDNHDRCIDFNLGNAPFLGIWAKPGASYVCIEPWFGINDSYDVYDDISKKRGIVYLEKDKSFTFNWSATVCE